MQTDKPATRFAPAERASAWELETQSHYFLGIPLLRQLFDAVPDAVMVLNRQRQIIFANRALYTVLNQKEGQVVDIRGLRPGEALDCVHALEESSGCGTSEFCSTCGAVKAILASQNNSASMEECRITRQDGRALDLRVWATPLHLEGEDFTVFAIKDISHEKRRRALERIFFHDLLNAAGGLHGFASLLQDARDEELETIKKAVLTLSERLIEEINAQQELTAAENEELVVRPGPVNSLALLQQITELYLKHDVARERHIQLNPEAQEIWFITDQTLLSRVIGNMVKNALEACWPGETVTLNCLARNEGVEFSVHNPNFMAREIQLQIFQRSFSTKGPGRGLGTYSIKLLTEQYLEGSVTFSTSPNKGTTFIASYPLKLDRDEKPPIGARHDDSVI